MDANVEIPSALAARLAEVIPRGLNLSFRHLATPPTRSSPIFPPPPGRRNQKTFRESHLLTVSVEIDLSTLSRGRSAEEQERSNSPVCVVSQTTSVPSSSSSPSPCPVKSPVFVFAIEVFVFSTRTLTSVFVSKADSTGFLSLANISPTRKSLFQNISTVFLQFIIENRKRNHVPLLVALFARAQEQYLFPGSIEYPTKHMATGPQLVRWWCRVLTPLVENAHQLCVQAGLPENQHPKAYLVIPGEPHIGPFLPREIVHNASTRWRWIHGHPFDSLGPYPRGPLRCRIPYFPDDPKSRFIDHLDEDLPDAPTQPTVQRESQPRNVRSGEWTAVRSFDQFWEFIAFRQECASGSLTGFFYLLFPPTSPGIDTNLSHTSSGSSSSLHKPRPRPASRKSGGFGAELFDRDGRLIPVLPRRLRPVNRTCLPPQLSPFFVWPSNESRGSLLVSEWQYNQAIQSLLRTDFSNVQTACECTRAWILETSSILLASSVPVLQHRSHVSTFANTSNNADSWSISVAGCLNHDELGKVMNSTTGSGAGSVTSADPQQASQLTTTFLTPRKKRPSLLPDEGSAAGVPSSPNVLSGNLVRKKPRGQK